MRRRGSVTIYLTLILTTVIFLVFVFSESARVSAVHTKSKAFTYIGAESLKASYARQLYKDYGILAVWEREKSEDIVRNYIEGNIMRADLDLTGTNFMLTSLDDLKVKNREYITDSGGDYFTRQVIEYTKYAAPAGFIKKIIENKLDKEDKEKPDVLGKKDIEDLDTSKLEDKVEDIKDGLEDLDDIDDLTKYIEKYEDALKNNKKKKLKKYSKKISSELKDKLDEIEDVEEDIKSYKSLRDKFLKENKIDKVEDEMDALFSECESFKKDYQQFSIIYEKDEIAEDEYAKLAVILKDIKNKLEIIVKKKEKKDAKEEKGLYKKAKELLTEGVLSLVVEDINKVSKNKISLEGLPSGDIKKSQAGFLESQKNKACLICYDNLKFGNYLDEDKTGSLKYGLEYILAGNESDRENLASTVERMVLLRNIENLAYLITDKKKQAEMSTIAVAVAAATALPFLEPIVKIILNEAWALAEAVVDVKALLYGKKISLIKTKENWNTELKSLGGKAKDVKNGITYVEFLNALLMISNTSKTTYRTMDLIQINIQKKYQGDFKLSKCFQKVDISAKYSTAPMFVTSSWILDQLDDVGDYQYNINVETGMID